MKGYRIDEITGVYFRDDRNGEFIYNEGSESENLIQAIINETSDISLGSEELTSKINNWFTLYHLSHQRSDLLRPFEDKIKGNILEIGSGCGALTRYLGELKNTQVFAIEGNSKKAEITKSRVRDLNNVNVIFENFINLELDLKFDVITMVGVLEYSRSYIASEEPVIDLLKKAKSLLKPDGFLIAAIENQLGLKYFAGAPEDHVGIPFFGIENKYSLNDPTTFGKQELTNKFNQAGFEEFEFLYPFPDYKLPSVILSDNSLRNKKFNLHDLLINRIRFVEKIGYASTFDENKILIPIIKNDLLSQLSNSFLIVTSRNKMDDGILSYYFSHSRKRLYCKMNTFKVQNNELLVLKTKTFPKYKSLSYIIEQRLESENYIYGELYLNKLLTIIESGDWDSYTIFLWAQPWMDLLISKSFPKNENGDLLLDGGYFDATPFNLCIGDELTFFDLEWSIKHPLKLTYILFRSLYYSLSSFGKITIPKSLNYTHFYEIVLDVLYHKFDKESIDFEEYKSNELEIIREILVNQPETVFMDKLSII